MSPPGTGSAGGGMEVLPLPICGLPRQRRGRVGPTTRLYVPAARCGTECSDSEDEDGYGSHTHSHAHSHSHAHPHDHSHDHDEADIDASVADDDDPPGGKKRKVPVPLVPGSEAEGDTGRDGADRNPPRAAREDSSMAGGAPSPRRLPLSPAAAVLAHRRAQFQRRKAHMVALYLDAQAAVEQRRGGAGAGVGAGAGAEGTGLDAGAGASPSAKVPGEAKDNGLVPLPDVAAFERLLPVLEDMDAWAADAPGWRDGDDAARLNPRRTLERWRTSFARRKRQRTDRADRRAAAAAGVQRGWVPEGSFELDLPTSGEYSRRVLPTDPCLWSVGLICVGRGQRPRLYPLDLHICTCTRTCTYTVRTQIANSSFCPNPLARTRARRPRPPGRAAARPRDRGAQAAAAAGRVYGAALAFSSWGVAEKGVQEEEEEEAHDAG